MIYLWFLISENCSEWNHFCFVWKTIFSFVSKNISKFVSYFQRKIWEIQQLWNNGKFHNCMKKMLKKVRWEVHDILWIWRSSLRKIFLVKKLKIFISKHIIWIWYDDFHSEIIIYDQTKWKTIKFDKNNLAQNNYSFISFRLFHSIHYQL
jgi:hypothetical protein